MFEKLAGRRPECLDKELYRQYAVIVPYLPEQDALLFEVRALTLRHQPGEIAFHGGQIEPGESPQQAALRELCEELAVRADSAEVIAPLDVYLAPYRMVVHPFLARLNGYCGTCSPDEVAEVFTVPRQFFMETEPAVHYNDIITKPRPGFPHTLVGGEGYAWRQSAYPVLFYQYQNRVIWGMTARIVRNLVELERAAEK